MKRKVIIRGEGKESTPDVTGERGSPRAREQREGSCLKKKEGALSFPDLTEDEGSAEGDRSSREERQKKGKGGTAGRKRRRITPVPVD